MIICNYSGGPRRSGQLAMYLLINFVLYVDLFHIVLCTESSYGGAADQLDGRASRPGPVSVTFEIIDAQIVPDGDDKYVVSIGIGNTFIIV